MKTAERENRNCWTASMRADGAAGQNAPSLIAWGWKQEKFQRWGKCFFLTSPSIERICHESEPQQQSVEEGAFRAMLEYAKSFGKAQVIIARVRYYPWTRHPVDMPRKTER